MAVIGMGPAEDGEAGFRPRPDMAGALTRRDIQSAVIGLQKETGLDCRDVVTGEHIEGVIRRRIDLVSGRFAMFERGHDFSTVPWRPVFDNQIGKQASCLMRGEGTHWTFGRSRGGPHIE